MNPNTNVETARVAAPAPCWAELSPSDRNTKIGELIGGEPMRRVEIVWKVDGKTFALGSLPGMSVDKAQQWLDHARQSRENWNAKFQGETSHPFALADQVHLREDVWHIRYSDTPGGGWFVIEAMQAAGFSVVIASAKDGWKVTCDDGNPNHGRSSEVAPTMAEAVCKLALRRLPPNNKVSNSGLPE